MSETDSPPNGPESSGTPGDGKSGFRDVLKRRKPEKAPGLAFGSNVGNLGMTMRRNDVKDFAYARRKEEVQLWLEDVFEQEFEGDVLDIIRDGTMLCELVNKIIPGSIPKIHKASSPEFFHRENIKFFVDVCETLGLTQAQLFTSTDLYDQKNPRQVISALLLLEQEAARRGFRPCISRLKEEEPPAAAEASDSKYEAVKGDEVDDALGNFLSEKSASADVAKPSQVHRLAAGRYVVAGIRINLKSVNGRPQVRVGGGWMPIYDFFMSHKLMEQYEQLQANGAIGGGKSGSGDLEWAQMELKPRNAALSNSGPPASPQLTPGGGDALLKSPRMAREGSRSDSNKGMGPRSVSRSDSGGRTMTPSGSESQLTSPRTKARMVTSGSSGRLEPAPRDDPPRASSTPPPAPVEPGTPTKKPAASTAAKPSPARAKPAGVTKSATPPTKTQPGWVAPKGASPAAKKPAARSPAVPTIKTTPATTDDGATAPASSREPVSARYSLFSAAAVAALACAACATMSIKGRKEKMLHAGVLACPCMPSFRAFRLCLPCLPCPSVPFRALACPCKD
eukprot:TRINITY_DN9046_c0_g1_i2.p1 TRINITY_DN9046_c0_g1~~TRINITY_DN9046_c0_g1_i2.p1  ORF type:complete len:565 (+),score=100.93 TRINITY_DN9046_c0_g1_i2:167-1861(+)